MKKLNILISALMYAMVGSGLLHANPTAIDIINTTGKDALFLITITGARETSSDHELKDFLLKKNMRYEINAPTGHTIKTIQKIIIDTAVDTSIFLDLTEYSEKVTIIYDGTLLMEESAYKLYKNSRTERLKEYSAIIISSLYKGFTTGLTGMQTWWTKWRESRKAEYYPDVLRQIQVHNELTYAIQVNSGMLDKTIKPNETDTFFKNTQILSISKLDTNDETLRDINIAKYTQHPKANHRLIVTIHEPGWFDRFLKRPIGFTITWYPDILE